MLRVDFRELQHGPVETRAVLQPDDEILAGLGIELEGPLTVDGRLHSTAEDEYLWRARLHGTVRANCRRCLTELSEPFDVQVDVLFSGNPDAADDPDVYLLPEDSQQLDISEAVREEFALAVPTFRLCRDDCAGLCPKCGADLNAGPCGCTVPAEPA